jgi:nucleoside-diphosphate-sugar epimerase
MRIGVTGASSGIGRATVVAIARQGHSPVPLVRVISEASDRPYDLSLVSLQRTLDGLDAVIHLAWDWSAPSVSKLNVEGGLRLARACRESGVVPVLLSTESASDAGPSRYGGQKRELEGSFADAGGTSLRAGIIWGMRSTGIVRTLISVARAPIPCVHLSPTAMFRHSEIDSVAEALAHGAAFSPTARVLSASSSDAVSLTEILHAARRGRCRAPMKVPRMWMGRAASTLDPFARVLPFRPDSLRALALADAGPPSDLPACAIPFPDKAALLHWLAEA